MKPNYQQLLEDIGQENFDSRFDELLKQINAFLDEGKYDKTIVCNERILYHVLLDYYVDISRLKEFHEIKHTKTDKKIAYLIYWLDRRKPIQITQFLSDEKDIFVNERFCCFLLLNECLISESEHINTKLNDENMKVFEKYIDMLLYYFKYRHLDAQMLELVIESFKAGRLFPITE